MGDGTVLRWTMPVLYNPSKVLQYSIDARPEPRSSPFDCGHNFRIGAAEKGMEDSIIKTRGDGIINSIAMDNASTNPSRMSQCSIDTTTPTSA